MYTICMECGKHVDRIVKGLCMKCYNHKYYVNNKEEHLVQTSTYQKNNPEKCRAYGIKSKRKRGILPMAENKTCGLFLGVHVAEKVLSYVFNNVVRQPVTNPGFDFICNKGKKIDVKSSCLNHQKYKTPCWSFHIDRNKIADYFLCLAFDNRKDLTPLHMWLLPADKFNHMSGTRISMNRIAKWNQYAINIDKVSNCCDIMRNNIQIFD